MYYEDIYWGMNLAWWAVWIILIIWIFFIPYDIPFQRKRKDSSLDILRKRFAAGHVTSHEYDEMKRTLEKDLAKKR